MISLAEAERKVDEALYAAFPRQQEMELSDRVTVRILEDPEYPDRFQASIHSPVGDHFKVREIVTKALRGYTVTFPQTRF